MRGKSPVADPRQQKYANLTMLEPLVERMVHQDPAQRPIAAEAHRQFKQIRRRVSGITKYRMLELREWPLVVRAVYKAYSFVSIFPSKTRILRPSDALVRSMLSTAPCRRRWSPPIFVHLTVPPQGCALLYRLVWHSYYSLLLLFCISAELTGIYQGKR